MDGLQTSDFVLWGIAGYIGVMALVRLMIAHRDRVAREVAEEVKREQHRQAAQEKAQEKAKAAGGAKNE